MPVQEVSFTSGMVKTERPESPTLQCRIQESDMGHIGHILMEVNQKDLTDSENICALTARTLYHCNSGTVISTTDLPYYWCNFCPFKTEQKLVLLKHMMMHRFLCKWCKYQSYSRADVMRHCIATHQEAPVNDIKFCVLLPDFLHSKLASEQNSYIDKQNNSTMDICTSMIQPTVCIDGDKVSNAAEMSNTASDLVASDVCENSRTSKKCRKRKSVETSEKPTAVKVTEPSKETENSIGCTFGVCFECCTCQMRTLQKQIVENHQQEMKHCETDRTTGKKPYVLKIINDKEKSSLQIKDTKWLEERKNPSGRIRRSKVEALSTFISKNNVVDYYGFSDADWDYVNALDDSNGSDIDDDNDEDYVPSKRKRKGKKGGKRMTTRNSKTNENSSKGVSKVDIEIDTAAELSSDTVSMSEKMSSNPAVQSYCVLNGENTVRCSKKKIVSRDMFDNSVNGESSVLMPEIKREKSSEQNPFCIK